ncbi:hypothetical protein [Paenibacillus massiliensis]|uniref:hypothetical protein n=1 Tax=Paenibacillus massiliensis TaxID=225917 RepID=UPI00041D8726|nr:hypothetical protein [Paenibacillus massiliensis]
MLQWILAACSLIGVYVIARWVVNWRRTDVIARQRYESFQRDWEGIEEDVHADNEVSAKKSS